MEKTVEKSSEVKTMNSEKVSKMKMKEGNNCKSNCCKSDLKVSKNKMSKMEHSADCKCNACKAKAEMKSDMNKDMKDMKKMSDAHPEGCACDHCKMTKTEIKKEMSKPKSEG